MYCKVKQVIHTSSFFAALFLSSCYISPLCCTKKVTEQWVIVHGTFATNGNWHKEDSAERAALKKALTEKHGHACHIHSFVWSGHNNHVARLQAAQDFITFLNKLTPPYHVIAHSHGGTVVLLAAQKLFQEQKSKTIKELYCLGTPLYHTWYPEAHLRIEKIYNLFSYGDVVQRVLTLFTRTFPPLPNVYNIQLKVRTMCPRHKDLHTAEVISHLPHLPAHIIEQKNYCVHLTPTPTGEGSLKLLVEEDLTRVQDLQTDSRFTHNLIALYNDSRRQKKL